MYLPQSIILLSNQEGWKNKKKMFYSHELLARKSSLGTAWCAAHLQHRLKKSQYISTNISSTVESIMYPAVPIALRMSGHLLLGVVRIYSKQVEYLYDEYHVLEITINKAFTSANVNQPEEASHAPFHSVTLPEKFQLDAMELDDYSWHNDDHLKSYEDITLTEQVPTGKDPYIVITFSEDSRRDESPTGTVPMEEDVLPAVQEEANSGFKNQTPRKQQGVDDGVSKGSSPPNLPSIEHMRDASHRVREDANEDFDFNSSPILSDRAAPDIYLVDQINNDNEIRTASVEKTVLPEMPSPSHNHQEQHSHDFSQHHIHVDDPMPDIRATPPPNPQLRVRRRKRNQHYDYSVVLKNKFIENSLKDTSDLRRMKKNCPCSSLDVWKLNNSKRKDGAFLEPLITGLCADLQDTYKDESISAKPHLITNKEAREEPIVDQSPMSGHDNVVENEHMRNNEYDPTDGFMPFPSTLTPSPSGRNDVILNTPNFELRPEHAETTEEAIALPTADMTASTSKFHSDVETPSRIYREDADNLFDIPELATSAGELSFLDQDDNSPAGSQGTPEVGVHSRNQGTPKSHSLSSRTRALAQYLKGQASVTPVSGNTEESSGDLSLLKILEGKPRKICARMFSETLVLKNYGLVDVHQEKAYDDITLKVTPKLFKEQFSS